MNEFKGTPGPWEIKPEEVDKHYIRIRGTQLGGRYEVANVLTPFYEGVHEREAKETRENARLIAAAPELLEALQMALEWIDAVPSDVVLPTMPGFDRDEVNNIINKALGETK